MSEISGMNQFGNFIINGKKLSFAEVDKNNDGVISQEEYSEALQTTGTDSFEPLFKNLDEPKTISEHAFEILNQKTVMQNLINELAGDISKDFSGKGDAARNEAQRNEKNSYPFTSCSILIVS